MSPVIRNTRGGTMYPAHCPRTQTCRNQGWRESGGLRTAGSQGRGSKSLWKRCVIFNCAPRSKSQSVAARYAAVPGYTVYA
eukprot:971182-Rhodomonas_salina.1